MAGIGPGYNGGSLARTFTEEQITAGLMAMVAWAGNASAASRYLEAEKGIEISPYTLNSWKTVHGPRYAELREKYSGEQEAHLAHEFRDVALLAVSGTRLAIDKAVERLESGDDQDPARSAANLARVGQSATDKLMTVTSRPTRITENRGTEELIRSLAAMGVLKIPDEPQELTEGQADE